VIRHRKQIDGQTDEGGLPVTRYISLLEERVIIFLRNITGTVAENSQQLRQSASQFSGYFLSQTRPTTQVAQRKTIFMFVRCAAMTIKTLYCPTSAQIYNS